MNLDAKSMILEIFEPIFLIQNPLYLPAVGSLKRNNNNNSIRAFGLWVGVK
jgi:hypothetical protein